MAMTVSSGPAQASLDTYIADYMKAMNAPGLTLGLADAANTLRSAAYGFADLDLRLPVNESHLFQIGSITKSFVALVLLQLRDEGRLDLERPILDYLPGLPIVTGFGPITTHHLLTHTSGLPDYGTVFLSDPSARLVQGFKPGEHFHYCNAGFSMLGLLAAKLDGRPWTESLEARILRPLEMTETTAVLSTEVRGRTAVGYEPFWDDQVYPRQGRLAPAPNLVTDDTDGCIASTPGDMAKYLRMLVNRGQGPQARIVSEEGFSRMATPYIKAPDFSETASYGYGIAVDTLDGHKILRHTGGMVAFASSIHVDLDGGVAAFASINAMQGYRPTAVTEHAVRLLRAERESKPLPAKPPIADPIEVENAADYAGVFTFDTESGLTFASEGMRLFVLNNGKRIPLQHAGGDQFISTAPGDFAEHTLVFGREKEGAQQGESKPPKAPASNSSGSKAELKPVVEVSYGSSWYVNSKYSGPRSIAAPQDHELYVGRYHSDSAWGGDARVYVLKDHLMLEGEPLAPMGARLFRIGDESWSPETAEFCHVFEGKARLLKVGGLDFWRIEVK